MSQSVVFQEAPLVSGLPPKSAEKVMLTGHGWFPALGAGDTAVLLPTPPVLPRSDLLRRGVPFYFPDGTGRPRIQSWKGMRPYSSPHCMDAEAEAEKWGGLHTSPPGA